MSTPKPVTRRDLLQGIGGVLASQSIGCSRPKDSRPNILVIVADDLGFSDLGCFGGEISTPHLNQMASEGRRLTQFYNCAVCVVSRASLMTGLHPRFGPGGRLRSGMITLAEGLNDAGYATAMTGKWHLGSDTPNRPIDRGFDEFYGLLSGACNYFDPSIPDPDYPYKPAGQKEARIFTHNEKRITEFPDGFYTTDAFTDHSVNQIETLSKGTKPFFLHLAYTAPHFPLQAFPEDIARYRGHYNSGYEPVREARYKRLIKLGLIRPEWKLPAPEEKRSDLRYDYASPSWNDKSVRERDIPLMEIYAAMVERMDRGVGRVMDALKRSGVDSNTIVFFFSDNGGCATLPRDGDMPYHREFNKGKVVGSKESYEFGGPGWAMAQSTPFRRYKTWTFEGGISTPFIVRWPGKVHANSISDTVGHVADFMPTVMELAERPFPDTHNGVPNLPFEGKSLMPFILGDSAADERSLGWFLLGSRAYRQGRWKVVWPVSTRRWELYDIENDRTECHNLAATHPEKVAELSNLWMEWAARTGAPTAGSPNEADMM